MYRFFGAIFLSLSFLATPSLAIANTPPAPSTATTCSPVVTAFSVYQRCATGSGMDFLQANFQCASFTTPQSISRGYCVNYSDLYQSAVDSCKNVCVTPSASVPVKSSSPPSSPPVCRAQELTFYNFDGACPEMVDNKPQYIFIDYRCGDETSTRRMGSTGSCQWGSSLIDGAQFYCRKNSCDSSTMAPSPIPSSTPIPVASVKPSIMPSVVPSPTSISACAKQLGAWKYDNSCGDRGFRSFSYQCKGDNDFKKIGDGVTCKTEQSWIKEASNLCQNNACATPTPIPSPIASIKPSRATQVYACLSKCYFVWNRVKRSQCFNACGRLK